MSDHYLSSEDRESIIESGYRFNRYSGRKYSFKPERQVVLEIKKYLCYIRAPYNIKLIDKMKSLDGIWRPRTKEWVVSRVHAKIVKRTLKSIYGYFLLKDNGKELKCVE